MRLILILSCVLLVASTVVFAQTLSTKITGVAEPPELTGEPQKVSRRAAAKHAFGDLGELIESVTYLL